MYVKFKPATSNHYRLHPYYKACGYNVISCPNISTPKILLTWIYSEMKANRVVHINIDLDGDGSIDKAGHNCIIRRIRYMNDFSKFELHLMNPDYNSPTKKLYTIKTIYQIFSVKPKI